MLYLDSEEKAVQTPIGNDFYIDLKSLRNFNVLQDILQA